MTLPLLYGKVKHLKLIKGDIAKVCHTTTTINCHSNLFVQIGNGNVSNIQIQRNDDNL